MSFISLQVDPVLSFLDQLIKINIDRFIIQLLKTMTFHRMDNVSKQVVFTNNSLRRDNKTSLYQPHQFCFIQGSAYTYQAINCTVLYMCVRSTPSIAFTFFELVCYCSHSVVILVYHFITYIEKFVDTNVGKSEERQTTQ